MLKCFTERASDDALGFSYKLKGLYIGGEYVKCGFSQADCGRPVSPALTALTEDVSNGNCSWIFMVSITLIRQFNDLTREDGGLNSVPSVVLVC
jgi:hypothetical protein